MKTGNTNELHSLLEHLYDTYDHSFLHTDPLSIVLEYQDDRDRETAAFITALLSLGSVPLIKKIVRSVLSPMGPSPYRFLQTFDPLKNGDFLTSLSYRFYAPRDIGLLVFWTAQMVQTHGSIQAFFMNGFDPKDSHIGPSLSRFVAALRLLETGPYYGTLPRPGRGACHFLTDPANKSACKRFAMFLRWMVRRDTIDTGIWRDIPPRMLIIPLDTHTAAVSRHLGLTALKSPGWAMAVDITDSLKQFCREDPVKYDFSLCRVGMLGTCTQGKNPEHCAACPIGSLCVTRGG